MKKTETTVTETIDLSSSKIIVLEKVFKRVKGIQGSWDQIYVSPDEQKAFRICVLDQ